MAEKNVKKQSAKTKPTENEIRKRAQKIYEKRIKDSLPGNEQSDWIEAEEELTKKLKEKNK